MAVTSKWRHHIENWQSSGLSQVEYCLQQRLNARTLAARLCEYRKQPVAESVVLVPVQVAPTEPASAETPALAASMVFLHVQGHRLEFSPSVPAAWVAELLRCLA
jgi:hypothetical protein